MDEKFLQLAEQAPHSCWVLTGNPGTHDFVVFPVLESPSLETLAEFRQRGFIFLGVTAIVDGRPVTKLAVPLDQESLDSLIGVACKAVEEEISARLSVPRIEERAVGAAFDFFMRSLMDLPDTRTDA